MNKETENAARKIVQSFKFTLLRKMPFYGDILMRLPVEANPGIPTARTDGGRIEYNPAFICGLEKIFRRWKIFSASNSAENFFRANYK